MHIYSHSRLFVGRFSSILFLLALIAAPAFAAQNQRQLASLQSPPNPQVAIAESFVSKAGKPQADSKARLYVTLINMSGKPRQAVLSKAKVELPAGKRVVLQMHPGSTLRVVSDADTKIDERFTISEQDAAKILIVQ